MTARTFEPIEPLDELSHALLDAELGASAITSRRRDGSGERMRGSVALKENGSGQTGGPPEPSEDVSHD